MTRNRNRPLRRWLTAVLTVPVVVFLCGGPAASQALAQEHARRDALTELARKQGLDPQLLLDPSGYARKQREAARQRRNAALAALPRQEVPAWATAEFEAVKQAQARHTLAGAGRDLKQGRKVELAKLAPEVRRLNDQAQRSGVRRGKRAAEPVRMMQRLRALSRKPRAETPALWRAAEARDLGAATKPVRAKAPGWQPKVEPATPGGARAVPVERLPGPFGMHRTPAQDGFGPHFTSHVAVAPAPRPPIREPGIDAAGSRESFPITPASLLPTIDAQSDHLLITQKAAALGHDPIRIFNFVRNSVFTELYAGSKKGAVGTLRELAGNDVDQASLLIALLRASGVPARYEIGNVAFNPPQANQYAGVEELSVAAGLLSSAGIPNTPYSLGPGQGVGLLVEHTWVRALVADTAYRGVTRPGAINTWAHLSPAIKQVSTHDAVDLRDAVTFDFAEYLQARRVESPLEVYEADLRSYVRTSGLLCPTLDAAQKNRTIVQAEPEVLGSELPVRRVTTLASYPEVPATERHSVRLEARSSQNALQFVHEEPMAALWGKSVSLVYEPATPADAATIAANGGLEHTAAYRIKMRALLKIDSVMVKQGAAESPGLDQRLFIDTKSPATGRRRVEHPLIVSGVYAFVLDPGLVPSDLLSERARRYDTLGGDDLEAEQLHVAALTYFHDYGRARERIAGLHWHRIYKEIEEGAAFVEPRVEEAANGVPLSVSRDFFVFDAPGLVFGDFSIDGDHQRTVHLTRLVGHHSSVLEHRMGERFRGPKAFSAVKLLQVAGEDGVPVVTFSQGSLEEALAQISWPDAREQRLRDFANRGYSVQAPVFGHNDAELGQLFGFIATQPGTGAGAYIVGTLHGETHGNVSNNGRSGSGDTGSQCCGETGSPVHLFSGNLPLTFTDLTLPARGMPLVFTRVFNTQLGWSHNFRERLITESDGSLTWVDATAIPWRFAPDGASGVWAPPPKHFQRIHAVTGGYEMRFKDGRVHRFGSDGRLLAHEDLNGHAIELHYGPDGRLAMVSGDGGNFFSLDYDALGRLSVVSDSALRQVVFGYDGPNITSETDVLGETRTYSYDAFGRMRTRSDYRGNLWKYDYDDVGRIVRLENPLGGVDTYAYDFLNRRTMHVEPRGHALLFELNELAKITRRLDALGNETAFTYDAQGNKTSEQDARGNVTTLTYDPDGNLLSRTDPLSATTTFTYGAHARLLTTTDPLLHTTTNTYDAQGNLLTTTDAQDNVTSYTYMPDGLPETITRPGGAVTEMFHDAVGNVSLTVDPEGGETSMDYDLAGHLTSSTDPEGGTRTMTVDDRGQMLSMQDAQTETTTFTYDAEGNRLTVTDPDDQTTTFEYDLLSRLVATTDTLGQVTRQEYDAEGRVVARIDARGFRTEMSYDPIGRLIETCDSHGDCTAMTYCAELSSQPADMVDPLGNVTHVECDQLGREESRTDPLGNVTLTSYDTLGRRENVADPAGHVTSFEYDELGRLTSVTDAALGVTSYGYDARGNRTSVTDANDHTTTFDYDLADRLIAETTPIGTVTEYGYDAAGNRTSKLDGKGQLTSFSYDANHRLTDIEYDDGTSASFDYDARGNRTFESNQDSTRDLTYDELGRLETVFDLQTARTIEYSYDASGNRASMRVMPDGELTTYAWDAEGRLSRMTDPEGGQYHFSYDAAGRRIGQTYPNGMTLTTVYDAASRIVSMVYRKPAGQVIESFTYSYDARGNRTAKIFADGGAEQYGYDELSRLTRATYPSGREVHYDYDPVGNRLQMTEGMSSGDASCGSDLDCDGVEDLLDNCPEHHNPGQEDSDAAPVDAVSAWRLDEPSGSSAQDAVGGNHGTLVNGPTPTSDARFGRALIFDGTNDRVQIPDSPSLKPTTALSMEAWVFPSVNSTLNRAIMEKGNANNAGYAMYMCTTSRPAYLIRVGSGVQSGGFATPLALNEWHHLAVTFDSTRADRSKLYVNGNEVVDSAISGCVTLQNAAGTVTHSTNALQLGSRTTTTSSAFFLGRMDEPAFWSRALTSQEVQDHAAGQLLGDRIGNACDPCPQSDDPSCAPTTCLDADGDGYGVQGASDCAGGVAAMDCDDGNAAVHPGTVDACDDVDNDCDGRVDDGCLANPVTTTYSYNDFNQLMNATGPGGVTTFAYDDNGNQTSKAEPTGATGFVWDARDRLRTVALPGGGLNQFGYDASSLRVSTQDATGTRRILLGRSEELAEYAAGSAIARYDHDPSSIDALLGQKASATKVHAVNDALGSVYGLTDENASTVSRYSYDVYGEHAASNDAVPTKFGFTGRVHEGGVSDEMYFRARYFNTATGAWTAPDPSGMTDGPNRYQYVASNPTAFIDPFGLYKVYVIGIQSSDIKFYGVPHAYEGWILNTAISYARSYFGPEEVFVDFDNDGSALQAATNDPETRGVYLAAHGGAGFIGRRGSPDICPSFGNAREDSLCLPIGSTRPKPFREVDFVAISACDSADAHDRWGQAFGGVVELKTQVGNCDQWCAAKMALSFMRWTWSASATEYYPTGSLPPL